MITQPFSQCFNCHSGNSIVTDFSSGTIVCTHCGAVQQDRIIDEEYESRGYVDDEGKSTSRIGSAVDYNHFDELYGVGIAQKKGKIRHRKNFNSNPIGAIYAQAENIALKLNIPKMILEKSKTLLFSLASENKIRGKNKDCVIAIVFFKVLFHNNLHRSLKDIAQRLGIEMSDIKKTYCSISPHLIDENQVRDPRMSMTQFEGNIRLISHRMDLDREILNAITEIGEAIIKSEIFTGKNPGTIASVAIYLVGVIKKDKRITLEALAQCSGIKERTIKDSYASLKNYTMIFPEKYKEDIRKIQWDYI